MMTMRMMRMMMMMTVSNLMTLHVVQELMVCRLVMKTVSKSNMYDRPYEGTTSEAVQESCYKNSIFSLCKEKVSEIANLALKFMLSTKTLSY